MQPIELGNSRQGSLDPPQRSSNVRILPDRNSGDRRNDTTTFGQPLPLIYIAETAAGLRILVPLKGIHPRQVYVFATPHSILVEMRARNTVHHARAIQEIQHRSITRELKFNDLIREGSTSIRLLGDDLEITCTTTRAEEEKNWSELVQLDMRGARGSMIPLP